MNLKLQRPCPACDRALTFWTGLRAPTPFAVRCQHCRTRFRVRMPGLAFLFVLLLCFGISGGIGLFFALQLLGWIPATVLLVLYLLLWLLLEVLVTHRLYSKAEFLADANSPAPNSEAD